MTTTLPVRVTALVGPDPTSTDVRVVRADPPVWAPRLPTRQPGPRTDIQALRAIAVALVLTYHLWPDRLTGGFVGVDVFFVVSGFLITAHLLSRPPRSGRDFAGFWARRIRRLLPAALLVLATTLIASRLLTPETEWLNVARQAGAAALYVENWLLAADSVNYLAAANAPTPIQHFWSLSVEEQFYLVWPLLIAVLAVIAGRRRWPRAVLAGLTVVVVASLAASVLFTLQSPAWAYFVTPTRAWEFGLGGLLAAAIAYRAGLPKVPGQVRLTHLARGLLAGIGLAGIGYAAYVFDDTTPFPGWWALIPTVGTVAVLAAMATAEVGPLGRVLALRPVQWLGDVSYSVYLWHWPLIVLTPFVVGGELGIVDKVAILVVTLLLAGLTKRFIEDRYRYPPAGSGTTRVFVAAAVGMVLVLILAAVQIAEVGRQTTNAERQLTEASAAGNPCLGAGSLRDPERCQDVSFDGIVPAPAQAMRDIPAIYPTASGGASCSSEAVHFPMLSCSYGDPTATRRMALVGNSHAAHWLPALEVIARQSGWRITTYIAGTCALVPMDQQLATEAQTRACRRWADDVSKTVQKGDFDLVVMSNRANVRSAGSKSEEQSTAAYKRGYKRLLRDWSKAGVRTLVVRDTPAPKATGISVPGCVAQHLDDLEKCGGARSVWQPADPLVSAVKAVDPKGVRVVDLNDQICEPKFCPAVVGGVLVYFDGSHLTATYSRTLAPALADQVRAAARAA